MVIVGKVGVDFDATRDEAGGGFVGRENGGEEFVFHRGPGDRAGTDDGGFGIVSAEAEEAETLRPLVLKFAGAVNLDKDWCKDNEPTINILRACLHKYMDAMALIRQGVRAVEK